MDSPVLASIASSRCTQSTRVCSSVSDQAPGTIVEEMQAGYVLKDRLLRPALVGVAKAG